ncbi:MAG: triose-phosphate isomerase [Planctomycetota bacterium]
MSDARKKTVGGNWKMNLDREGVRALSAGLAGAGLPVGGVDVAVYCPFPYLAVAGEALGECGVKLGAQDFYVEPNGAFTGEVSLAMLQDCGVSTVLVGHSERRHVIGEDDGLCNAKVLAGLEAGLEVVLCVGEKLEQREAGQTDAVNAAQLCYGLAGVTAEQMARVTIAYEPVWAIGTGKTATPGDAQSAHAAIRGVLGSVLFDEATAAGVRIQYGGSMKPGNAAELMGQPDVDGGLIGGASLKVEDFSAIVGAAAG